MDHQWRLTVRLLTINRQGSRASVKRVACPKVKAKLISALAPSIGAYNVARKINTVASRPLARSTRCVVRGEKSFPITASVDRQSQSRRVRITNRNSRCTCAYVCTCIHASIVHRRTYTHVHASKGVRALEYALSLSSVPISASLSAP